MLGVKRIEHLGFNPIIVVRCELGGDRPGFKYTNTYVAARHFLPKRLITYRINEGA